jgi:hypothetical protein
MSRAPAALADLLRAFSRLQPENDAARAEIARMLGLEPVDLPAAPEEPAMQGTVRVEDRGGGRDEIETRPHRPPARASASAPAPSPGLPAERDAVLTPDFTASRRPPAWLEQVDPLPEADSSAIPAVPVPDPLFAPQWTRSLLSGSLSTSAEIGPLDEARLVRGIARGIRWQILPRRPWPTLARGVQVLVDRSESMAPFVADQKGLVERLRAVVGRPTLEVLRFDGCPGRGAGAGPRRTWEPYFDRPLPPGTAVLALTDLGIGDRGLTTFPVLPEEWITFAEELRRRGCPLIAFVPYRRERWPAELGRVMALLPWDRGTSVRTVRRAIGRALAIPRGPRT